MIILPIPFPLTKPLTEHLFLFPKSQINWVLNELFTKYQIADYVVTLVGRCYIFSHLSS